MNLNEIGQEIYPIDCLFSFGSNYFQLSKNWLKTPNPSSYFTNSYGNTHNKKVHRCGFTTVIVYP